MKTQVCASFHMRADARRKVLPKLLFIELCVNTSSWCLSKKNQYSRGVGRYSTKIYTGQEPCTGRLRPEVTPLTPLYTTFTRHGTPFTYLVYNFAYLFDCCKYTFLKIWIKYKTKTISWLFHSHVKDIKGICYPFWTFLKSLPFHIPEA